MQPEKKTSKAAQGVMSAQELQIQILTESIEQQKTIIQLLEWFKKNYEFELINKSKEIDNLKNGLFNEDYPFTYLNLSEAKQENLFSISDLEMLN